MAWLKGGPHSPAVFKIKSSFLRSFITVDESQQLEETLSFVAQFKSKNSLQDSNRDRGQDRALGVVGSIKKIVVSEVSSGIKTSSEPLAIASALSGNSGSNPKKESIPPINCSHEAAWNDNSEMPTSSQREAPLKEISPSQLKAILQVPNWSVDRKIEAINKFKLPTSPVGREKVTAMIVANNPDVAETLVNRLGLTLSDTQLGTLRAREKRNSERLKLEAELSSINSVSQLLELGAREVTNGLYSFKGHRIEFHGQKALLV
ncbi:MAG: hypothetical protein J0L82_14575 [Deltaproteobacteria bacterium]|nr:hypothetical protein [Deltaproteobacteria bacterium]